MSNEQTMKELAPDVPFPWSIGEGEAADTLLDADGNPIAQFYGPDNDRKQAMMAVVVAVNTLAGYRAEITT